MDTLEIAGRREALGLCTFAIPASIIAGMFVIWVLCAILLKPYVFCHHARICDQSAQYFRRNHHRYPDCTAGITHTRKVSVLLHHHCFHEACHQECLPVTSLW